MTQPHRVTVDEIESIKGAKPVTLTFATTADRTQRKRLLGYVGKAHYEVARRYYFEWEKGWKTVYSGDSLEEAVHAYNRLG